MSIIFCDGIGAYRAHHLCSKPIVSGIPPSHVHMRTIFHNLLSPRYAGRKKGKTIQPLHNALHKSAQSSLARSPVSAFAQIFKFSRIARSDKAHSLHRFSPESTAASLQHGVSLCYAQPAPPICMSNCKSPPSIRPDSALLSPHKSCIIRKQIYSKETRRKHHVC